MGLYVLLFGTWVLLPARAIVVRLMCRRRGHDWRVKEPGDGLVAQCMRCGRCDPWR